MPFDTYLEIKGVEGEATARDDDFAAADSLVFEPAHGAGDTIPQDSFSLNFSQIPVEPLEAREPPTEEVTFGYTVVQWTVQADAEPQDAFIYFF